MAEPKLDALAGGRESFLGWVEALRPSLHRYCARMMGSTIDGEDVVQEVLAKAFYELSQSTSVPPLKPWLLRIAHNTAVDHLRRADRRLTDSLDALDTDLPDDRPDPATVRAALAAFLELPPLQRSSVILKDVLDLSNEELAATLSTTVPAVKAALVRGRRALADAKAGDAESTPLSPELRATLERYVARFNARDWDGLRALLAKDVELDLVSKARRRGEEVGQYFGNYAKLDFTLRAGRVDGRPALGVFPPGAATPAYFVTLEVDDGGVRFIRDYRYVGGLAGEFAFTPW
jgi:RNA polymerase sigma-70 factor (ECF subfamily)